ncbi:MAG: IS1595 family transposase [Acidobacteriota bacterium]
METPNTLMEAIQFFANPDNAISYLVAVRWPNGATCPYCEAGNPMFLATRRIWKCRNGKCGKQFSIKVGTIMEDSAIGLDKWLTVMWLVANCKNGVSSYEIARDLGVTQKSAWFMLHRVRESMQDGETGGKLAGEVEVDETFIGGKARNMHTSKRRARMAEGHFGKVIAFGMVERGGRVKTSVVGTRRKSTLQKEIREHVKAGSAIFSDELLSYEGLSADFKHAVINHAVEYVRENVHTNTMENFWSLVKRQLKGTYISVEPFHLFRYLDEQAFRYNNRNDMTDADRFRTVCKHIAGRRLTWNRLTGKEATV